jgi:NCS1 family nucleobase:cation symporter-1
MLMFMLIPEKIIGGWIMVPWKIVTSATSLINFMASLGAFLSPLMAISIADYWVMKKRRIDVSALYQPNGRYRYWHGVNWRAIISFIVSAGPNLPGMAQSVNPSLHIGGAVYIEYLVWYYGFLSAFCTHSVLNYFFPATQTLLSETISGDGFVDDTEIVGSKEADFKVSDVRESSL